MLNKQENRKDFDVNTDIFLIFFDNNFKALPNIKKRKMNWLCFKSSHQKREKNTLKITQEIKWKNKYKKYKKRKK